MLGQKLKKVIVSVSADSMGHSGISIARSVAVSVAWVGVGVVDRGVVMMNHTMATEQRKTFAEEDGFCSYKHGHKAHGKENL